MPLNRNHGGKEFPERERGDSRRPTKGPTGTSGDVGEMEVNSARDRNDRGTMILFISPFDLVLPIFLWLGSVPCGVQRPGLIPARGSCSIVEAYEMNNTTSSG